MGGDLLDRMRRNPAGDWTIADVENLCRQYGIGCRPPSGGGSHFKISHDLVTDILTIPARRPIKQKYIRLLVKFVSLVLTSRLRT
jgi:hypothetical protein